MPCVEGEIVIHRPAEVMFDFVADGRNEPRYNPRMVSAETLCDRADRRRHAVSRRDEDEAPDRAGDHRAHRVSAPMAAGIVDASVEHGHRRALTFEPVAEGTRTRWQWELKPRGALELMGPIIARIGERQEREIWAGLKRWFEEEAR